MIDAFWTTTRRSLFSLGAALGLAPAAEGAKKKKGNKRKGGKKRCQGETKRCGKNCFDLQSSKTNCGRCGRACAGELSCASGSCTCLRDLCRTLRVETNFFPDDIATMSGGQIIAVERDRLLVFDLRGNFELQIGEFGIDPGEFASPSDIAVDASGSFYVADSGNERIQRLNGSTATAIWEFDDSPDAVAVTSDLPIADRVVYTAFDGQIHRLDAEGDVAHSWGPGGDPDEFFDFPADVAADEDGHVFVLDESASRVYRFTDNGGSGVQQDWAIGAPGVDPGEFRDPTGIGVGRGLVVVADTSNNRIQGLRVSDGSFVFERRDEDSFGPWEPEGVAFGPDGRLYITSFDTIFSFELGEP